MFETQRLILRPFTADDWQDLYEYSSGEGIYRYLPEWECTEASCREEAEKRAKGGNYWAVCLKDGGKVIGDIVFHRVYNPAFSIYEIGYVLGRAFQGKGYALEASRRIMRHGFEDKHAHRIIATCDPENAPSWRLLERLHMRREAHFKQCLYLKKPRDGETPDWRDEYHYAILHDEWLEKAEGDDGFS